MNPFEFSRQQSDDTPSFTSSSEPEVSQYKASQSLFNPYKFADRQICGSEAPAPSSNNPSSTPSAPAPAPSAPVQTPPPPAAATPGLPPQLAPPASPAPVVNVNVQPVQSPPPAYVQQPTYVQQQAPPPPIANVYGCGQPTQVTCPSCRAVVVTRTQTSMSTIDIVMIILGIFLFCFLLGIILIGVVFLCSPWSDVTHFCPRCGQFIGKA
uniref:LITAF domain-containing protein n=1 Tax=Panagrolaimus davidi TaxID=227884 RepID=A0A914P7J1_9BILA